MNYNGSTGVLATKILCYHYDEPLDFDLHERLFSLVDDRKREMLEKYRLLDDSHRSLIADVLLRSLIAEKLKCSLDSVLFRYGGNGKPLLAEGCGIYVNASHSRDWVVAAIGDSDLGIDIERIGNVELCVAERFFSDRELVAIRIGDGDFALRTMCATWALKESYAKLLGLGLKLDLRSFTATIESGKIAVSKDLDKYTFWLFEVAQEYCLALCKRKRQTQDIRFEYVDVDFLRRLIL